MPKNLLIVESPAKAKTIEKFLGKDFTVKSSFGHVRDLEKGEGAVEVDNNFHPRYVVTPDKTKVVKELRDWVGKVDEVWLATDEDREGEAISWHLCEVLHLDPKTTKRIVFREITKPAILKAIQKPRTVDLNLVDAQQARRVLDRLVGYKLSGILWKKIKGGLSAGRVQSVAVKLIVEREREINEFNITPFYKVTAVFQVPNDQGRMVALEAESPVRYDTETNARNFLEKSNGALFTIRDIEVKPLKRSPAAPFTTSTLQQEASRKLGFSVNRTMSVAQRLYEAGHITYMRTDSINLSETAIQAIIQSVTDNYGQEYAQPRRFKSKQANAQEAHEAIRPTYIEKQSVSGERDEQRLYELIWKRTIASQMADAQLEKTIVSIGISTIPDGNLQAVGEVLKFDGFLKVYLEGKDEEEEETKGMLPPLNVSQQLQLQQMNATQRFTKPPARYSEAALVKKLEELGIGRPSTYAPTISKIMEEGRGYVVKESREGAPRPFTVLTLRQGHITSETKTENTGVAKNVLFPTDMGITVIDFLDAHFKEVMNYKFTAGIEEQFDEIATTGKDWTHMMRDFFLPFSDLVEKTAETAERPSRERILGKDPESGRTLLARMSRNGPVIQIGSPDELASDEKPRYANLKQGQSLDTISFEEALDLFQLPFSPGSYKGEEIIIGAGRYGPYIKIGDKFISIPRGEDPMRVDLNRAIEIIEAKLKDDAPVAIFQGHPVTKGKGRFGPFIKWNDLFINVPKKYDFDHLTENDIVELVTAKLDKEASRYVQKWDELGIAIENGRWGPFIRFGKTNLKIPAINGHKVSTEEAAALSLEQVKSIIIAEIPDAFEPKKKKTAKTKKSK
jgi:DNA topoisomerase I